MNLGLTFQNATALLSHSKRKPYPKASSPMLSKDCPVSMTLLHRSLLRLSYRLLLVLGLACHAMASLGAEEINLQIFQRAEGNAVFAGVKNNAGQATRIHELTVELAGREYRRSVDLDLASGEFHEARIDLQPPSRSGTYVLTTGVVYRNNRQRASLSHSSYFNFGEERRLPESAQLRTPNIRGQGQISIIAENPQNWRWVLPEEFEIVEESVDGNRKTTTVRSRLQGVTTHYPIAAAREETQSDAHASGIVRGRITMDTTSSRGELYSGRFPSWLLLSALLLSGGSAAWLILARTPVEKVLPTAIAKASARLFWASALYLLIRHGDNLLLALATFFSSWEWLEFSFRFPFPRIALQSWNPLQGLFDMLGSNFRSAGQYGHFFRYVADPYWIFCGIGCFLYSYLCDREKPLSQDKYSEAFRSVLLRPFSKGERQGPRLSKAERKAKRKAAGNAAASKALMKPAQLGILVLCVKLFYLPYLSTWVINNIIHQRNLTDRFIWDWDNLHATALTLNTYLLATFILVDTAIFAFGYCFEHKKLNNQIRSVEPTVVGWVVTLWCYPPFNTWTFRMFDIELFPGSWPRIHQWYPDSWNILPLVAVTACWGVFMWASIALGFKASNLTNRGIVSHGPYRYCRHPAYTIKVISWIIEGILLGKYFGGLLFGFALIYFLRAWTEERHLSRDPDFIEYKKSVPYRFIPGLF